MVFLNGQRALQLLRSGMQHDDTAEGVLFVASVKTNRA